MSRAERRQYQRTVGRKGAGNSYPSPPGRPSRQTSGRPARGAAPVAARSGTDLRFTRRFWVWTLLAAAGVGVFLLSIDFDKRPVGLSVAFGVLGAAGWVVGAVASRLVRRRLSAR